MKRTTVAEGVTEKILKVGADGRSYRKEVGYRDARRLKSRFKSIFMAQNMRNYQEAYNAFF